MGDNAAVCGKCEKATIEIYPGYLCRACYIQKKDGPIPDNRKATEPEPTQNPCFVCGQAKNSYYHALGGELICSDCYELSRKKTAAGAKPPVGIKPRNMAEHDRMAEIMAGVERYVKRVEPIPIEWIEEYNDLANGQKGRLKHD